MLHFFVVFARRGELDERTEDAIAVSLGGSLRYRGPVKHRLKVISRPRRVGLFVFSNEPTLAVWRAEQGNVAVVSGYTSEGETLCALEPENELAKTILAMPGRFSAAVFDPKAEAVAVANSAVRIDSLFRGRNDDYTVVGTHASSVARLVSGTLRYETAGLFTFINTGFFGTQDTAFQGVTCLPPASTWLVDGGSETLTSHSLGELKDDPLPSHRTTFDRVAEDLQAATQQMNNETGALTLGLTGGMDSRLLLAATLASDLTVECSTDNFGPRTACDIYVAQLIAERLGLSYRVVQQVEPVAQARGLRRLAGLVTERLGWKSTGVGDQSPLPDYFARTAETLRATDGALYGYDALGLTADFRAVGSVNGLGGEILRGGYAEKRTRLDRAAVCEIGERQFASTAAFFRPSVAEGYRTFLHSWVEAFPRSVEGLDILDCMYAEFRCGRWVGGSTRSITSNVWHPFLDNRLTHTLLRIRAVDKQESQLHRGLLERLCPSIATLPLANKFWPGTTKERREALRSQHPAAYASSTPVSGKLDWRREFPPAFVRHIQRYCLAEGRIELLDEILDVESVSRLLRSDRSELQKRFKFVHGLYSACVLVSGDWLKDRSPGSAPSFPG